MAPEAGDLGRERARCCAGRTRCRMSAARSVTSYDWPRGPTGTSVHLAPPHQFSALRQSRWALRKADALSERDPSGSNSVGRVSASQASTWPPRSPHLPSRSGSLSGRAPRSLPLRRRKTDMQTLCMPGHRRAGLFVASGLPRCRRPVHPSAVVAWAVARCLPPLFPGPSVSWGVTRPRCAVFACASRISPVERADRRIGSIGLQACRLVELCGL
jgi:hypothetical protein